MHSIRVKITAITVAAILTSILSVFVVCNATIQAENDHQSVETMNLIGQNTRKSLEKYFESIEQSVEMAANIACDGLDSVMLVECGVAGNGAGVEKRSTAQTARLDAYLADYSARVQEAFSSVASHTKGVVTYYYCISPDISVTEHGFFYSKVGKTGFTEQPPLDARELDPDDMDHTTWYYTPIQRGRPSWVGPYTAHFLGEIWICSYLVPIYRAGAFIGVLGMDITLETLIEQVSPIRFYKTGFACLFDGDGNVLYHPELPIGSGPDRLGPTVDVEILRQQDNGDALIRYTAHNERRQMSFTTLSNGMKLVITAPESEINASWVRLWRVILLITAAIIALFAVLLLLAMRIITRPLRQLTVASRRLAAADYDVALNYRSRDEVGDLTRAFTRMRDQQKRYIEDLNRRIYTDPLTGLPNMRYFFKLADEAHKRLLEEGRSPVMLYFNLIGMKHYNRQYGFDEGDQLIREIGAILARRYGEKRICRFGQDQFAAVSDGADLEAGLRAIFRECQSANGGRTLPVRVGIYPDSMGDVDVSIACDRAKYACDLHRGTFVSGYYYFDDDMLRQVENARYVISHLDQALSEHWIKVCYQPIIRAVNGRVCDEEALSRWIDPERGPLSPGDFIPILENARLIDRLDLYVLDQILEKMKLQARVGLYVVPHSLNLSRVDFDACDIVEEICRRVDAAGIERSKLTIEITESMVGRDFEFMKAQVERFQKLGFKVWMDDFGSGYSSLDVLQDIHFDLIKFDMRFMNRFDEGDKSKVILTELIRMAIGLGIDTVCEGVETREQVEFLREIGCTKLQGFYYCKAVPLEEIIERNRKGIQIGFENPEETEYYEALGRVNLYDLAVVAREDEAAIPNYFNNMPMGIMEIRGDTVRFVRTNPSYRVFMKRFFGFDLAERDADYPSKPAGLGAEFMALARRCCESGDRAFFNERMPDGAMVHSSVRRLGKNPVTGMTAVAVAVLSVSDPE